jgi:tetratricopeptide (TPR) repeat protein
MRKTLNVKVLVFLVFGFIFFVAGVHFLHAYQMKRSVVALRGLAEREEAISVAITAFAIGPDSPGLNAANLAGLRLDQNKWLEARVHRVVAAKYLRRYLAHKPGDFDALVKYGQLVEAIAVESGFKPDNLSFVEAYQTFNKILRLDPEQLETRCKLVVMAWMAKRYTDAQAHLQVLLPTVEKDLKQKAELELMLGQCCEANGKYESSSRTRQSVNKPGGGEHQEPPGAKEYYSMAIEDAKEQVDGYVFLANLYRHLNKVSEADAQMNTLIKENAQSFQAYLARAKYWKKWNDPKLAAKDIEKAYDLVRDKASLAHVDPKVADEMQQVFLLFADLVRDRSRARVALEQGLKLFPENADMYRLLAALELADNKPQEAEACLREGLKVLPANVELLWDFANFALDTGKDDTDKELADICSRMEKRLVPAQLRFINARKLMNKHQWSQAIEILEKKVRPQLKKSPELVKRVDLALGSCYSQSGQPEKACAAYRRITETEPFDVPACFGMSSALVAQRKIDEAVESYRRIFSEAPLARLEAARLLIRQNLGLEKNQRQWQKAEEYLNDPETAKLAPVEVTLLRAEVCAAQDQKKRARDLLKEALVKQPKEVKLWIALANVVELLGDSVEALTVLNQADKACGDRVELGLARAQYWTRRDPASAQPALAEMEKNLNRFSPTDRWQLLNGLAASYANPNLKKMEDAKRIWIQLAKEHPHDVQTRLVLFDIALESGDRASMDRLLEEIRSIADCDVPLANALREEIKLKSTKEEERDYRPAIDNYGRAIERGERNPMVAIRRDELLLRLAGLREKQGRPGIDEAEKIYRDMIAKNPSNYMALNNLAYLLAVRDRRKASDEALEHIKRAIEIAGPLPAILDTQAVAYIALEDGSAAVRVLEQAMKLKSAVKQEDWRVFSFHLAKAEHLRHDDKAAAAALAEAENLGLKPEQLHLLERESYQLLRTELRK